jgi:hypothetical protein
VETNNSSQQKKQQRQANPSSSARLEALLRSRVAYIGKMARGVGVRNNLGSGLNSGQKCAGCQARLFGSAPALL